MPLTWGAATLSYGRQSLITVKCDEKEVLRSEKDAWWMSEMVQKQEKNREWNSVPNYKD